MPFRSQAQRRFMYSQHPELAKEFEAATPKGKDLPEHVKKKRMSTKEQHAHMNAMIRGGGKM